MIPRLKYAVPAEYRSIFPAPYTHSGHPKVPQPDPAPENFFSGFPCRPLHHLDLVCRKPEERLHGLRDLRPDHHASSPSALMMIPESSGFTSFSITGDWLFPVKHRALRLIFLPYDPGTPGIRPSPPPSPRCCSYPRQTLSSEDF